MAKKAATKRTGNAKGKPGRPRASVRAKVPVVPYPRPSTAPDWSQETLALLRDLTPMERSFCEWIAAGCSASEAYIRAGGTGIGDANDIAYQMRQRGDVRAAIDACMRDRSVGARSDREWKLAKLRAGIEVASQFMDAKYLTAMTRMVKTMAKLQGEIVRRNEVTHIEEETPAQRRLRLALERALAVADGRPDPAKPPPLPGLPGTSTRPAV